MDQLEVINGVLIHTFQSSEIKFSDLAVLTTMCCISLQVRLGLAWSANAQIPAAKGAEALVPV